uniref:Uncharacterized protein n=1 Tax=Ditylenchus dipsaci TaxID=166011 RepID=A0A915E4M6_9BILA
MKKGWTTTWTQHPNRRYRGQSLRKPRNEFENDDRFGKQVYYSDMDGVNSPADGYFANNGSNNRRSARVVRISPVPTSRSPRLTQEWRRSEDI